MSAGDIQTGNLEQTDVTVGRSTPINEVRIHQAAEQAVRYVLHQLLPPPPNFVGRIAELAELATFVKQGAAIVNVWGVGGVGKTSLALQFADRVKDEYPGAQFFIDVDAVRALPLSPDVILRHILHAWHPEIHPPDDLSELHQLYRSTLQDKRVLIVLDDAVNAEQLSALLPLPTGCLLVVTSQQQFELPELYGLNLDVLSQADALAMLRALAPRADRYAIKLISLCERRPLALHLAGSALAMNEDLPVLIYMRRLAKLRQQHELIIATLSLSYSLMPETLRVQWRALAVFPTKFGGGGAAAVWGLDDQNEVQGILIKLRRYWLLELDDETHRYYLHDQTRLFALGLIDENEYGHLARRHATYYAAVLHVANQRYRRGGKRTLSALALFDREWENLRVGQAWAAQRLADDEAAARLCDSYSDVGADLLALRLHPREYSVWLEAGLAAAHKLNAGLRMIDDYERLLVVKRKLDNRQGEANALVGLGNLYSSLSELESAAEYYEDALSIYRALGDRCDVALVNWNLGLVAARKGDVTQAVERMQLLVDYKRETNDAEAERYAARVVELRKRLIG